MGAAAAAKQLEKLRKDAARTQADAAKVDADLAARKAEAKARRLPGMQDEPLQGSACMLNCIQAATLPNWRCAMPTYQFFNGSRLPISGYPIREPR